MSLYLCYDVKGIQSFIFKIPKLKYIIGGSALIDKFDRETIRGLSIMGTKRIYSGGGKGAFICDDKTAAEKLKEAIIIEAHEIGLDIRFGQNQNFSEAINKADEIYPFIPPDSLDGEPCNISGLYPVKKGETEHPVVHKRIVEENNRWFEKQFVNKEIKDLVVIPGSNAEILFFRNVDPNDIDPSGKEGHAAIGKSNRWAVICMDGNDMGLQFKKRLETSDVDLMNWIIEMSSSLDYCSHEAARCGMQQVINERYKEEKNRLPSDRITLPVRPIVVGGDDITILCHAGYAMTFVKEAIRVFNETSILKQKELEKKGINLWPATNGQITISAGILYCPVSLPLHTAIAYTESLLASAKSRGRRNFKEGSPSPACIDWEQVTESVIDTPTARRKRELSFFDKEINEKVDLTQRPYTLDEFKELEELVKMYRAMIEEKKLPTTIRNQIRVGMRAGFSDRLAFIAGIKNNHKELFENLCEYKGFEDLLKKSRWKTDGKKRSTDVLDALLLLEEENRMERIKHA